MSTDTKRQPKGIPVGGQFAATAHAEPDVVLGIQQARQDFAAIDTPLIWTDPATGEKVLGRSIGEVDNGDIGFQVPGSGIPFTPVPVHELEIAPPPPPAPPVKFTETQRRIRGHNFFPPKVVMSKIPGIGATEDIPFEDKKVHLHYFTGAADWYLMELDQTTGKAFGFLNPSGSGGSWGYVSLPDLEKVNLGGYRVVERDCHFSQDNLREVTRHG